jgi:hypothetical protein
VAQGVLAELIVADAHDVDGEPGQRLGASDVVRGLHGIVVGTPVQLQDQA